MKKLILAFIICTLVLATLAMATEAANVQKTIKKNMQVSSKYNFGRDKSVEKRNAVKIYREKMKVQRFKDIEKSDKQYAKTRESKMVQNKATRMQKIVLANLQPVRVKGMVSSKKHQQKKSLQTN